MNRPEETSAHILARIREQRPLVLCLTNTVAQEITANLLLAVGAVPAMLSDAGECADMIRACANALLVNTGTLSAPQAEAMQAAILCAGEEGIPWVLDPVACGLLDFRTRVCREFLQTSAPALIRGNASEIIALAGASGEACRGPESGADSSSAIEAAQALARRTGAAVLATGQTDYATDGDETIACANGHALMTRVTGIGCAMGALAAACAAVASSPLEAAIATASILGIAGERSAEKAPRPGSFAAALLDELDAMTPDDAAAFSRLSPWTGA